MAIRGKGVPKVGARGVWDLKVGRIRVETRWLVGFLGVDRAGVVRCPGVGGDAIVAHSSRAKGTEVSAEAAKGAVTAWSEISRSMSCLRM